MSNKKIVISGNPEHCKPFKAQFLMLLISFLLSTSAFVNAQDMFLGFWNGKTDFSGMPMRAEFEIFSLTDKNNLGIFRSPDQGEGSIPIENITVSGENIRIELPSLELYFEGNIEADNQLITGSIYQRGTAHPITLQRTKIEKTLNRPQEPMPPFSYYTQDVVFENKTAGIKLAGTLCLPNEDGVFPIAIMISGSGPQDRNEEILGHKPFLVLADHLAKNSIGSLRFDDRGVGESEGDFSMATSLDFAEDVNAAFDYLKTLKTSGPIGLIGHSEGGLIAPIVASANEEVAFLISMAGTGVKGDRILYKQSIDIAISEGLDLKTAENQANQSAELLGVIQNEADSALASDLASQKFDELFLEYRAMIPDYEGFKAAQINSMNNRWMRYFLKVNPADYWRKVKCPVLAINGTKDTQVNYEENLNAIEQALMAAMNEDFSITSLRNHNHLFQRSESGRPSEYGSIEETMSVMSLELITEWMQAHFVKN